MNVPMIVLNRNAKREKGQKAQLGIIAATKAVSDIVRTTLGPRAMLKMLLDPNGNVVLTNDGASILREIEVQHPAAKTILELSRTQDERVGDGTTSVVILAGELMAQARPFFEDGMHPSRVVASYTRAAGECVAVLGRIARDVDAENVARLEELAANTLDTKFVSRFGSLLPSLAVEAVRKVCQKGEGGVVADLRNLVKVEKIPGDDIAESRVLDGVMINKDILHQAMRRRVENPKILLLDCALEYKKGESETNIEMKSPSDWKRYLDLEEDYIRKLCSEIRDLRPDVLVTEKGVSDMAQHFLQQANISVLRRTRKSDLHRLALACGATIGSQPAKMSAADVGKACGLFEVRKIGDEYWSFFEKCTNPKACTVLLRGAGKDVLSEMERNLQDAMGTVRNVMILPKVVPGGGAAELALAAALRRTASELGGEIELKPYLAVAAALEIIPKTLVQNCGGNVNKTLSELRALAAGTGGKNANLCGVDGKTGEVTGVDKLAVWEPLEVKMQTIKTAFEAVTLLLRIDDILSGVSKKGSAGSAPQMPAMSEEDAELNDLA